MYVPTKASGPTVTEYFSLNNRDTINTGPDFLPPLLLLLLAAQMNRCGAVNAQQRERTTKTKKKKIQHGGPTVVDMKTK